MKKIAVFLNLKPQEYIQITKKTTIYSIKKFLEKYNYDKIQFFVNNKTESKIFEDNKYDKYNLNSVWDKLKTPSIYLEKTKKELPKLSQPSISPINKSEKALVIENIKFTGMKDIDMVILRSLPDESIFNFCSVNKYLSDLCKILYKDDDFWENKFRNTVDPRFMLKEMSSELFLSKNKETIKKINEQNNLRKIKNLKLFPNQIIEKPSDKSWYEFYKEFFNFGSKYSLSKGSPSSSIYFKKWEYFFKSIKKSVRPGISSFSTEAIKYLKDMILPVREKIRQVPNSDIKEYLKNFEIDYDKIITSPAYFRKFHRDLIIEYIVYNLLNELNNDIKIIKKEDIISLIEKTPFYTKIFQNIKN